MIRRTKIWAIDENGLILKKFGGSYKSLSKWLENDPDYFQVLLKENNGLTCAILEKTTFINDDGETIERTFCYTDKLKNF